MKADDKNAIQFILLCKLYGIDIPKREYKFHATRKFRFDFAWIDCKLAVEIEGGVWIGGRHTRGTGYVSDMHKYNLASCDGWRVLRFTPQQIKKVDTYLMIKQCLEQTK